MDLRMPKIENIDISQVGPGIFAANGLIAPTPPEPRQSNLLSILGAALFLILVAFAMYKGSPFLQDLLEDRPVQPKLIVPTPATSLPAPAITETWAAPEQSLPEPDIQAADMPVEVKTMPIAKPEAVRTVPPPAAAGPKAPLPVKPAVAPIQPLPPVVRASAPKATSNQPPQNLAQPPSVEQMSNALPPIRRNLPQMPPAPTAEEIPNAPIDGKGTVRKATREEVIRSRDIMIGGEGTL